jgi:hypothetical protein
MRHLTRQTDARYRSRDNANALLHGVFKVRNNLQLLENEAFRLSRSPPWQNAS